MTLAEAFDAERRKKQAIMMDISKATGIGLADLSSMRNGRYIPDDTYLIRLEKFFNTEQGYFRALAEKERPRVIEVEESVIMGLQQDIINQQDQLNALRDDVQMLLERNGLVSTQFSCKAY